MIKAIAALWFGVIVVASAACADPPLYTDITDNLPTVGLVTTVYLGDRMLAQRHGEYRDCIIPLFDSHKSINLGFITVVVKAGESVCKMKPEAKYYTPNYDNVFGNQAARQDFSVSDDGNGGLKICIVSLGAKAGCTTGKKESDFKRGPIFLYTPDTLQQTIEYSGRSGNVLRFSYSEYSDGFAKQAFTREFQVDLSEGNVAAYKGAIIEIEKATNSDITFKVVRNFQ